MPDVIRDRRKILHAIGGDSAKLKKLNQHLFERMRSPNYWHSTALGLRDSARHLWARYDAEEKELLGHSSVVFSTFMLTGMTVEALLKTLALHRNSDYLSEVDPETLCIRRGKAYRFNHRLEQMVRQDQSEFLGAYDNDIDLLKRLGNAIRWGGRYPCPMDNWEVDISLGDLALYLPRITDSVNHRQDAEDLIRRLIGEIDSEQGKTRGASNGTASLTTR